jgi:RNA polymerase sigma factor (sigma-70 family)
VAPSRLGFGFVASAEVSLSSARQKYAPVFEGRWRTLQMSDQRSHFIRELFARNKRDLLMYFTRRVGADDASDLLQETFVRALRYESLHKITDPPAFLQKIATNLTRDLTRRRKHESTLLEHGNLAADAPSDEALPEERIDFDQQSQHMRQAMEKLPPRCREILVLAIHQNLPLAQIAQRLGISENAVRKQLRRAILRCRAALD